MIGYFVSNPTSHFYQSEIFSRILKFVQAQTKKCKLKEDKMKLSLTVMNIQSVEDANLLLHKILEA